MWRPRSSLVVKWFWVAVLDQSNDFWKFLFCYGFIYSVPYSLFDLYHCLHFRSSPRSSVMAIYRLFQEFANSRPIRSIVHSERWQPSIMLACSNMSSMKVLGMHSSSAFGNVTFSFSFFARIEGWYAFSGLSLQAGMLSQQGYLYFPLAETCLKCSCWRI